MKTLLFVLLLQPFVVLAHTPTTYYVSASGNDTNNGITTATAWQTIAKVNTMMSSAGIQAGDSVLFERGNVFTGKLIITVSGTSALPVSFGAYGTGNAPVITASVAVSGWTSDAAAGSNIWKYSYAYRPTQLFINNVPQQMARYPNRYSTANGGYLTYSSYSGDTEITSSTALANVWTGAEVVTRIKHYDLERLTVKMQSGTGNESIHFTTPSVQNPPTANFGFFLQNDTNALDQQGEWCYQNGALYLYTTTNPSSMNISVAGYGFNIYCKSNSYISISNLELQDADTSAIYLSAANNISVQGCTISQAGVDGIDLMNNSANFTCQNNTITNIDNDGIYIGPGANHASVENNTLTRIGLVPGAGQSSSEKSYAAIVFDGTGSILKYNHTDSVGCNGVECWSTADSMLIQNNYIAHCEMVQDDNGCIHVLVSSGVNYNTRKITGNILLSGVGSPYGTSDTLDNGFTHGIYLDQRSKKYTVTGNTIAHMPGYGILLHGSKQDTIEGNTCFDNGEYFENNLPGAQVSMQNAMLPTTNYNDSALVMKRNILVSLDTNQKIYTLMESVHTGNACTTYSTYDSNYYCRPMDTNKIIYITDVTVPLKALYGLAQWNTYASDPSSKPAPEYYTTFSPTDSVLLYYNSTSTVQNYTLPSGIYLDVLKNSYVGTITLAPYTSIVLFYASLVGIEAIHAPSADIDVYPTPSSGITYISSNSTEGPMALHIYDETGKAILVKSLPENFHTAELNLGNLPEGAYYYTITQQNSSLKSGKLIIYHN